MNLTEVKARAKRTTGGVSLGKESSREAKCLAAAILEVLAGERTPAQAAEALSLSLPRYYQLEARGLGGLLTACEPRTKGRQRNVNAELIELRRQNERLQRELARQQALVRLTQRAAGLPAPPPPVKVTGKKIRKRRPAARALTVAARLQEAPPAEATMPSDNGVSASSQ